VLAAPFDAVLLGAASLPDVLPARVPLADVLPAPVPLADVSPAAVPLDEVVLPAAVPFGDASSLVQAAATRTTIATVNVQRLIMKLPLDDLTARAGALTDT